MRMLQLNGSSLRLRDSGGTKRDCQEYILLRFCNFKYFETLTSVFVANAVFTVFREKWLFCVELIFLD